MMKKIFVIFFLFVLLSQWAIPAGLAASMMPEFLCETGMKFYKQGRYEEALQSFLQALILEPNYKPALQYIQMLKQKGAIKEEQVVYPETEPAFVFGPPSGKDTEGIAALEKEMISSRVSAARIKGVSPARVSAPGAEPASPEPFRAAAEEAVSKTAQLPAIIKLDETYSQLPQPIEISQGESVIISGKNIQRFLVIEPAILEVDQKGPDELKATAGDIGYTYVHVWDENDRWTMEFLVTPLEPEGPTYDETLFKQEEESHNFKLNYGMTWTSSESGRRLRTLNRSSYSWAHRLILSGETPYGDLQSETTVRSLTTTTDMTYLHFGLTDGSIGPFKGFSLQGFDYSAPFSNLSFSGGGLRGAMLASPAFGEKIRYAAFWGREGGGKYGNLSPGLSKIKNSFLNGFNAAYSPTKAQTHSASITHGWGRDRDPTLPRYVYDTSSKWNFEKWGLNYDLAFDNERVAYTMGTRYSHPDVSFSSEFRNVDKHFYTISGLASRSGELGNLFNLNYRVTEKLKTNLMLDVFLDRSFPAEDNPNRLNESLSSGVSYQLDPSATLSFSYNLQNRLGSISQSRYQTDTLGLSKRFNFFKEINTFMSYSKQDNNSYSSPSSSYTNDKAYASLSFDLLKDLRYYLSREMNWLRATYTGESYTPNFYETGLDWSGRLWETPLYGNFRLTWHDEEDAGSALSFLSGEDYLEGYSQLSYRPDPNKEFYGSCGVRNCWADSVGATPRIDVNFNAGMRYLWDTGVSWESSGNIEGYVFKDLNSDGLRQRDEAPVEGVKIYLGKDKFQVTDIFGYYKFRKAKGRKAYITLDASTLPPGFVVTVPISQEISIAHNRTVTAGFGIISRSEISGLIFEDMNEDGKYNLNDKGVSGVVLTLEDGSQATSDDKGKYSFLHASAGEHVITIDLGSIPVYYLPQTSLTKELTLYEGVSFVHNVPLKRIKE